MISGDDELKRGVDTSEQAYAGSEVFELRSVGEITAVDGYISMLKWRTFWLELHAMGI